MRHCGFGLQIRRPCRISVSDAFVHPDFFRRHRAAFSRPPARSSEMHQSAVRHPQHCRSTGQSRHAERVTEHDVCRLAADAGQLDESSISPGPRRLPVTSASGLPSSAFALLTEEPGRLDLDFEGRPGSRRATRRPVRVAGEQRGVTSLTRRSVDCAERIVATSSSKAFRKCSSVVALGCVSRVSERRSGSARGLRREFTYGGWGLGPAA